MANLASEKTYHKFGSISDDTVVQMVWYPA